MTPDLPFLVLTTFGSADEARRVARQLVEERLAACANLAPGIESIYHWEGNIESAQETLVIFKTPAEKYCHLETRLRELHSYEVPELVAIRMEAGNPAYLRWIADSCAARP